MTGTFLWKILYLHYTLRPYMLKLLGTLFTIRINVYRPHVTAIYHCLTIQDNIVLSQFQLGTLNAEYSVA